MVIFGQIFGGTELQQSIENQIHLFYTYFCSKTT